VVLLWPVGSTEPHGPHSPLATDPIISVGIAERVARRLADDPELRALILPTLAYAVTRYTAGFAGAIHVEEATLEAMVVDVCRSPAEATAEEGEETYATLVELTIELIRELVAGTGGRDRPGLFGRV